MKQFKHKNQFVDLLTDAIDEGLSIEQSYSMIIGELSRQKSKITLNQIIKEFKILNGHDPEHYKIFKEAEEVFIDNSLNDELLEAFSRKMED